MLRDVTERRVLEDQLRQAQKMEAVGQLAGGVAHDFNNLLTVIGGYGEIARRRIGAGPGADELTEVRARRRARDPAHPPAARLLAPAGARRRSRSTSARSSPALLPMLRRLIGEDIEIAVLADAELPPVLADRAQLEQVVMNLAVNARDAMPTGGTLTIETRPARRRRLPGASTDTGVGHGRRETLEHVFEPFFTTKEVGQGTGLGLATVHGIVSQSGGRVHVYSEPGLGTSFKVYLPRHRPRGAADGGPRRPPTADLGGTETILLCEDEDGVRHLIEHVLTTHGYRVLSADGPHAALERAVEAGEGSTSS